MLAAYVHCLALDGDVLMAEVASVNPEVCAGSSAGAAAVEWCSCFFLALGRRVCVGGGGGIPVYFLGLSSMLL